MAQLFDVVRARLQAEARPARPSIRVKPLLVAASAGALFLKAPPRAEAAPVNTSPPAIAGVLEPERTLTATPGTWTDAKSRIVGYKYQWLRCNQYVCTDIDYITDSTFTLPWELVGAQIEVTVTAIDAAGEFSFVTSEMTDVITYNGPSYTLARPSAAVASRPAPKTAPRTPPSHARALAARASPTSPARPSNSPPLPRQAPPSMGGKAPAPAPLPRAP
jgi:hypothetical protein